MRLQIIGDPVLHSKSPVIQGAMLRALGASMSGSGPSVFGLFEDGARAQDACSRLRESYRDVFLCAPQ